jgi:hypothetical protein
MIIFGSFLPSLGLVGTTKSTQVEGADIVMKSCGLPSRIGLRHMDENPTRTNRELAYAVYLPGCSASQGREKR